jgi:hypothetical protein
MPTRPKSQTARLLASPPTHPAEKTIVKSREKFFMQLSFSSYGFY